ncbi:hypothetical protein FOL47_000212, partial [Perkinsus chesapeaki]
STPGLPPGLGGTQNRKKMKETVAGTPITKRCREEPESGGATSPDTVNSSPKAKNPKKGNSEHCDGFDKFNTYFRKENDGKNAVCLKCKKRLSLNKGYSSLKTHPCYKKATQPAAAAQKPTFMQKFLTDGDFKKITDLIVQMIVLDGLPLCTVDRQGFVALVKYLTASRGGKDYKIPSRRQIGRLLDDQLQDRIENAKNILQKQSVVSITADSWQRKSNQSVMGVVVHHCPEDQEQPTKTVMKSTIIGLEEITEDHTAVNLADVIYKTLLKMEIVAFVVTDSGSDIRRAATKLLLGSRKAEDKDKADLNDAEPDLDRRYRLNNMVCWLPCAGHRLHLAVSNALKLFVGAVHKENAPEVDQNNNREDTPGNNQNQDRDDDENANHHDAVYSDQEGSEPDDEWSPEDDAAWLDGLEAKKTSRNQHRIHNVLTKCRKMLTMLRVSGKAAKLMEDVRGELPEVGKPNMNYMIDTPTRWNSTLAMVENVLKNELSFDAFQSKIKNSKINGQIFDTVLEYAFEPKDYYSMRDIVKVLRPFSEACKYLAATHYPTLPRLYSVVGFLKSFLQDDSINRDNETCFYQNLQKLLVPEVEKYFQYTKTNKWVRAGNYLLPETRNVTYPQYAKVTDEEGREAVIKCINDMNWDEDMPEEEENTDIEHADEEEDDVFASFATRARRKQPIARVGDDEDKTARLRAQLGIYETRARTLEDTYKGPLREPCKYTQFWQAAADLGEVQRLALILGSVPTTSISSESCFSVATNIARNRRRRLTPHRLRSLVILRDMM